MAMTEFTEEQNENIEKLAKKFIADGVASERYAYLAAAIELGYIEGDTFEVS